MPEKKKSTKKSKGKIAKIIEVIPITKGMSADFLSYYTTRDIDIGSIVTIEIRKRNVPGIVVGINKAEDAKQQVRSSDFQLKPIKGIRKNTLFSQPFLETVREIADIHAGTVSSLLQSIIPKRILEQVELLESVPRVTPVPNPDIERYVVQENDAERFAHYKSLIREEFAQGQSVFFCVPAIADTHRSEKILSKGIEESTFVLHSGLGKKETLKRWNTACLSKKPVVIIATPSFIGIPRYDIKTFVIDQENSKHYKLNRKPYIDLRLLIEKYAQAIGAKIMFGDILLRLETLWRYDNNEFHERAPLKFRSISNAEQQLVDMSTKKDSSGGAFQLFCDDLINKIIENHDRDQHLFLYVARKGLAPTIVCSDCGHTVSCTSCSSPMVLHGRKAADKENMFRCHKCGEQRDAGEKCVVCNGWRLQTLGIGAETVEAELQKRFPEQKVFRIDADTVTTPKQGRTIQEEFYETPGSILIGTEMALPFLDKPIENIAVVSIDALFTLPDFRIRERVLRILLMLRSLAMQTMLIQTRFAEESVFRYARIGNVIEFYREELKVRKQFLYPPFSTFIKITVAGPKQKVTQYMEELKHFFLPQEMSIYPAFTEKIRGQYVVHGLIRLQPEDWIDEGLLKKLKMLPPYFKIDVDPENLL